MTEHATAALMTRATGDRARRGAISADRIPSQRELVAWSLLMCPDGR